MQRSGSEKKVFFIGLFISFFLDGSISQMFASSLYHFPYAMVPYLTVLWLVLGFMFSTTKINYVLWAIVIGFIFDLYYTGILGIFVFIFPLTIMLTRLLYQILTPSFFSSFLIYFIDVAFVAGLSYVAMLMIGQTQVTFSSFLVNTLAPTLALNLILLLILYFPISGLYNRFR